MAGNGLFLPQRQFIQFASHPLLRSEEWLGKRAAGSWLNAALECDGRLLWNHSSSLRGAGCWQEAGSCAVQSINSKAVCSHKALELPQATACVRPGNPELQKMPELFLIVLCYTLGELFPWAKGPWAELRQPYNFPRKHQATSLPGNRPSQSFHHQETAQGPVSRSWAPMSICMCYVEQQQKACKQSPFFSPAFECLVPRLKLLSKYWFQLKKWSGNLSCCHFKQLSYSFPGFPRHLFSTWKKKSWGRAWRISNSFMLSRPAEAWSKLQKAPKAHMHPWHMHRNNCKHACSKPYTFRRNLSPYLFAELIHMQLRTSGQPTSNGSNTLPTLQACWACAVLQMWDSSGRDRCKQKYDSFKLSLKSLHHSN